VTAAGAAGGTGGAGKWYFDDTALIAWATGTPKVLGDYVKPTVADGFGYECTTAGTTHATTEPVWPGVPGSTVADNDIVWTCRAESNAPRISSNGGNGGAGAAGVVITEQVLA